MSPTGRPEGEYRSAQREGLPAVATIDAGDRFEADMPPIATTQLVKYAGASDDYNRIHYDLPYATDAGLGGVIAHGMLTMGLMARALLDWSGPRAFTTHIDGRFTAPVRPGDTVRVTGTVTGKTMRDDGADVDCELVATVAGKIVAQGKATVRFPA